MIHPPQEEHLISQHRALARQLARRFSPGPLVDEDLLSVATIALVAAARRFDTDRNIPFHSFAAPTIIGEIKRFLRDQTWAAHVPRRLKEVAIRLEGVQRAGQQELGRSLTVAELAERLGVGIDTVREGLEAAQSRRSGPLTSVDRPFVEQSWEEVATFVSIEQAMEQLSEDERGALLLRYSEDLTQAEIGARLGYSQPHVHRLIRRGLDNLRSHFDLVDR
ncbi:MAG: sigma-70 family RNA polymerase sigma factor [Acidimicrobiales bacterium]